MENGIGLLDALNNPKAVRLAKEYIALCKPAKVTVLTDAGADVAYARKLSQSNKEERDLTTKGHTIHFDGYFDQGRDVQNTRILLAKESHISKEIKTTDRDAGLKEMHGLLDGIMKGKEMLISFFCLGPRHSKFSLLAMQITDSAYVTHSEMMLYRPGFEEFKQLQDKNDFFFFVHSSGELNERSESKNTDKRRIYVDLEDNTVFSINNQYAGNSVGLKKLALRLAINRANHSDWLSEHMFISGVKRKGRITYFTGAYPSACGKTSTAMIPGHTLVGDDISYIRINEQGIPHAVNVEQGIFGIIADVNPIDDPVIYKVLTTPRELIFSNILIVEGKPYWTGMGQELPKLGENYVGKWYDGMKGPDGKEVPASNKNARYTVRLTELENVDKYWDTPTGVPVSGMFFGVRDASTNVPILQSFSWQHGVMLGASTESEKTAAVIGKEGAIEHDPMSILDFLVVPLGLYMKNYLSFGKRCSKVPIIFTTNYFLKHENRFLNDKVDKKVWLIWAEGRANNEYGALKTPIGFIPKYDDLHALFSEIFMKEYRKEDYIMQFSIRSYQLLSKFERVKRIFDAEPDMPPEFMKELNDQISRLKEAISKHGQVISPLVFEEA